jgi:hypothetical protein
MDVEVRRIRASRRLLGVVGEVVAGDIGQFALAGHRRRVRRCPRVPASLVVGHAAVVQIALTPARQRRRFVRLQRRRGQIPIQRDAGGLRHQTEEAVGRRHPWPILKVIVRRADDELITHHDVVRHADVASLIFFRHGWEPPDGLGWPALLAVDYVGVRHRGVIRVAEHGQTIPLILDDRVVQLREVDVVRVAIGDRIHVAMERDTPVVCDSQRSRQGLDDGLAPDGGGTSGVLGTRVVQRVAWLKEPGIRDALLTTRQRVAVRHAPARDDGRLRLDASTIISRQTADEEGRKTKHRSTT